jgi:hypothetical protein
MLFYIIRMVSNLDQDLGIPLDCFYNGRDVCHFLEKKKTRSNGQRLLLRVTTESTEHLVFFWVIF